MTVATISENEQIINAPFMTRVYLNPIPIPNSSFRKSRAGIRRLIKNANDVQRVKLLLIKGDMDNLALTFIDYNR